MATCSFENCQKKSHAQALCTTHYSRLYRYGNPAHVTPTGSGVPVEVRMAARTKATERGCLEWTGQRSEDGYGYVTHRKKRWAAHRLAWTLANGPIPDGLFVCHHCDNPPCINVKHLFLGTAQDNMDDCVAKGRVSRKGGVKGPRGPRGPNKNPAPLKPECRRGHAFDEANTRINKQGHRVCRKCFAAAMRAYNARKALT